MNQKYKIAYLDYSHIFSGAEMSLHSLVSHLDTELFEPILLFRFPQSHQKRYDDLPCRKIHLVSEKKWWMGSDRWQKPIRGSDLLKRIIFGFKIIRLAKQENIDILHINLIKPETYWCAKIAKWFGIKVVGHSRSDAMSWIPSAELQKQCDAIICVSDFVRTKVLTKYASENAYTVYDPIDFDSFQITRTREDILQSFNIDPSKKVLASVGLLSPQKGHDIAIRVFASVVEHFPNHILIIAGGGGDDELMRLKLLAQESNVAEQVLFTEKQIPNIAEVYHAAELIFSVTTTGEAFGRVPFEAMACGTPVIAPTKGAAVELITDNETGFLADPFDLPQIIDKALFVLNNPSHSTSVVAKGQKYFKALLSPSHSAEGVANIYRKVLDHS
ncbi:glycosyltransferase family 4 protein [Sulfuricurvum sp.]|uniref:glycosyltransferase family 4 protein n=1 Tax=Sulfuricurvum sp. TaxID=2025608 RepID=UPI002614AF23|nr:glycosyltransferase family 4 protein [Sulfuricurvum sp.]MDD3598192.1 glycosyltransferase family 4 protein [Sulfuricurvum sp.]